MPTSSIVVLTNDDGVDAPGLEALGWATRWLEHRRVVAPLTPQSGCSHTITTHAPLVILARSPEVSAVNGTPADCVRLAIYQAGSQIGWVLSGINAGGNLGADVHQSGTIAAVREAAMHGIPGIAISHYIARSRSVDWELASRRAERVLRELIAKPPEPGTFWNVNLPHPEPDSPEPSVVYCPVDTSPRPVDYRPHEDGLIYCSDYQARPRRPSADIAVCFGGQISVSKIRVVSSVTETNEL